MAEFEIRTDLALETRESFKGTDTEISGVVLDEDTCLNGSAKVTRVMIKTDAGAAAMKKPKGTYITLEVPKLREGVSERYIGGLSHKLGEYILELLPVISKGKILIVGLGNKDATPDSLGPETVERIRVTRNFTEFYGENGWEISCITPGVMAKTGMESSEIIKGIVQQVEPDAVIAVDALAARSTRRLNTTFQLTDTGINPGSGVGNHRQGLTRASIGVPVIAIGVPTVVDAATIVRDIMDSLIRMFSIVDAYKELSDSEQYEFIREISSPEIRTLYVTPKDIDEDISRLGIIISEALNSIWREKNE